MTIDSARKRTPSFVVKTSAAGPGVGVGAGDGVGAGAGEGLGVDYGSQARVCTVCVAITSASAPPSTAVHIPRFYDAFNA